MENQNLMVNQNFFDKGLGSCQSNISSKVGESNGAWNLSLNVVVMLVSVNTS